MKHSRSKLQLISFLSIGFILGIGIASAIYLLPMRQGNSDPKADATSEISGDASTPVGIEGTAGDVAPISSWLPIVAVRNLDELNRLNSFFDQELALRILLADSNEVQVAELLQQSQDLPSTNRKYHVQRAVIQRFTQLSPTQALSQVLEMSKDSVPLQLVVQIFREWSHTDLDEAVAHARTLQERLRESVLRTIIDERKDLSADTLRSIAQELGDEQVAVTFIAERRIEEAKENPETLWNELVIDMQDDSRHIWSLARVASAWVEKSGLGVMDQIADSLTNSQARKTVVLTVLNDAAYYDPAGAFSYAMTIENDHSNATIGSVTRVWASSDPQSALSAVTEVQHGPLRRELQETIVRTWAREKPRELMISIDGLPDLVRSTALSSVLSEIAGDYPKEAASLVVKMEAGAAKAEAASGVVSSWSYRDPKGALDWVLNEPAIQEFRPVLLETVLDSLVEADPELAMDTAVAQPISDKRGPIGMEYIVISNLSRQDLNKAIELFPQVRAGFTKQLALQTINGALIRIGKIDDAFAMVEGLPESERQKPYMDLASSWAGSDPEEMLNSMNRFPSEDVRSKAAMELLTINQFQKSLTDEQVAMAKKFLSDEDTKSFEKGGVRTIEGW
ncbi:MAG: hypothetical protein OXG24_02440 [Gammaproteobacteria bacterium]|nr:hypothetical protein [Gammaproteobacteria bacterium]